MKHIIIIMIVLGSTFATMDSLGAFGHDYNARSLALYGLMLFGGWIAHMYELSKTEGKFHE